MVLMSPFSATAVPARRPKPDYVPRGSLQMFDLFRPKGSSKWYLNTGRRTTPPSEVGYPPVRHFGRDAAGNFVVGFQSVRVKGTGPVDEDGTCVSFNAHAPVEILGNASRDIAQASLRAEAAQRERERQAAVSASAATANHMFVYVPTPQQRMAQRAGPHGWMQTYA